MRAAPAPNEGRSPKLPRLIPSVFAAARHRNALGRLIGTELTVEPDSVSAPRQRRVCSRSTKCCVSDFNKAPSKVPLTVKLSGRPKECPARRTRTLSFARSERKRPRCHGPLQRLLEDAQNQPTVRARLLQRKPRLPELAATAASASATPKRRAENLAQCARARQQRRTKGLCPGSSSLWLSLHSRFLARPLTVKLRGRTTTPDRRRGRTLSPGARGPKQTTHHGPLQRLLEGTISILATEMNH